MSGLRERLLGGLYLDLNRDYRNTVFLAGSGRSGTTWLADIINYRREYRFIFEPFNPERVGICRDFYSKQYLRPDDRREEFLDPARKILSGGVRSAWTDRFNRSFLARRRLVKDIRANLLLGWLHANFPEMPMVLLLRHPCAVAASRMALGWRDNLSETMRQEDLVEDFLRPMEGGIRSAKTPFERHLFLWCVDNYVPLMQLSQNEAHLVFYENLVARPEEEIPRLFDALGVDLDERVYEKMKRPSPLSRNTSMRQPPDDWRERIDRNQLRRALEILALFGLDRVYGEDSMPDTGAAREMMRSRAGETSRWTARP
ncbi:MAG TPA: sulfotransferase [Rubrobacteraceae bacterium]|nr:sulfotransferase [Rubrobacteraceae bacterium]